MFNVLIASLHEAKEKANIAMYKSDFTDDIENNIFYRNNKLNSPVRCINASVFW